MVSSFARQLNCPLQVIRCFPLSLNSEFSFWLSLPVPPLAGYLVDGRADSPSNLLAGPVSNARKETVMNTQDRNLVSWIALSGYAVVWDYW
jgi:hypothetical protein